MADKITEIFALTLNIPEQSITDATSPENTAASGQLGEHDVDRGDRRNLRNRALDQRDRDDAKRRGGSARCSISGTARKSDLGKLRGLEIGRMSLMQRRTDWLKMSRSAESSDIVRDHVVVAATFTADPIVPYLGSRLRQ